MSDVLVHRPARTPAPPSPAPLTISQPPGTADPASGSSWTYALFPLLGAGGILVFALVSKNPIYLLAGGVFVLGALGMGAAMYFQTRGRGKEQSTDSRLRYFTHLDELRSKLRDSARTQRERALVQHPEPAGLTQLVHDPRRLWERRPTDDDFLLARVGRGTVRAAAAPGMAERDPMASVDPACEQAADRLVDRLGAVRDVPVGVPLRGAVTTLVGEPATTRPLARAMVCQLAALHAPDEVRIALCAPSGEPARSEWDWLKWLPHTHHPGSSDAGSLLLADTAQQLVELLDAEIDRRRASSRTAGAGSGRTAGPEVVVVVDGAVDLPDPLDRLEGLGFSVLRLVPTLELQPRTVDLSLRLTSAPAGVRVTAVPTGDDEGRHRVAEAGDLRADALTVAEAETLARRLSPLRLTPDAAGETSLSEVSGLGELLGVPDVAEIDPRRSWESRSEQDLLRVPLGVAADGRPVELDLKESAQSGMGPHGIVVGATGSGKSELLRTLVSALAITHSPEELAFVLVDFKGGATFAGMTTVPHVAGSITDLEDDPEMIDRFERAVRGELRRREELLRDSGNLVSIREHRRRRLSGAAVPPMPHLLIVVDEFSELLVQQPDLVELFVAIGRLGRSLGVHLLLATQRLEEGRIRGLESHLSYRLALKTFTAQESRALIGSADAFELPPVPGSAYLKVDTSVYERLRVSTVSGPYAEPRTQPEVLDAPHPRVLRAFPSTVPDGTGDDRPARRAMPALGLDLSDPNRRSTLDVIVDRLRSAAPPVHQVWVAPLPASIGLGSVLTPLSFDPSRGLQAAGVSGPGAASGLQVPIGVVDLPEQQRQEVLAVDLAGSGGHVGIAGAPQTGKSTALAALAMGLATTHTPAQVQIYGIDLGGGVLGGLEALPHVGGIAGRRQPQRVRRLVAELTALVEDRERWFGEYGISSPAEFRAGRQEGALPEDGYGDVVLLVDGWMAVRSEFEDLEDAITQLANRGLTYGLHVAVTTARWWDIRAGLRDSLGTKIELKIGDVGDSVFDRRVARTMPSLPGRALVPGELKAQVALPRFPAPEHAASDGAGAPLEEQAATMRRIAEAWPGEPARPIRLLPHHVELAGLADDDAGRRAPIGLRERDLRVAHVDLVDGPDPHLLVLGDAGSGKTAALRTLLTSLAARNTPEQLRVIVVDPRRSLLDVVDDEHLSVYCGSVPAADETLAAAAGKLRKRLPGPEVTVARLRARDWWTGARFVVVVDDHDLVATPTGDPLGHLVDLLPQGRDIGLHLVVARGIGGAVAATGMIPTLRRLVELGTPGLMLSGAREEGPVLHGVRPQPLPPGRARLVGRQGAPQLIQVAWAPEPSD